MTLPDSIAPHYNELILFAQLEFSNLWLADDGVLVIFNFIVSFVVQIPDAPG